MNDTVKRPNGTIAPSGAVAAQLNYALGKISYDFGTEAQRDSIAESMDDGTPSDPKALLAYLDKKRIFRG